MERLVGRVALITGCAGGIGKATAERLAIEGATVIVADVSDDTGQLVASELSRNGPPSRSYSLDVTRGDDWIRVIDATIAEFGHLDILVNNAGVFEEADLDSITLEQWNQTIAVTQTGVFLGMKSVGRVMAKSDCAAVVNISSVLGSSGGFGSVPAYHAAKGAVRTLTKNAAVAWTERGIRVNSIHPGFIDIGRFRTRSGDRSLYDPRSHMRRRGWPHEVAAGVAYLASDDASFVTGSELYIDGGYMAQ